MNSSITKNHSAKPLLTLFSWCWCKLYRFYV